MPRPSRVQQIQAGRCANRCAAPRVSPTLCARCLAHHKARKALGRAGHTNAVLALWTGRCALTGRPITMGEAELDHRVPLAQGGPRTVANLHWTWRLANRAKAALTPDQFLDLCRAVVAHSERAA